MQAIFPFSTIPIQKIYFYTVLFCIHNLFSSQLIETIYGSMVIEDPVVIDILNSHAMLRLKKINQYGVWAFIKEQPMYTRYDHSLGVYFLLKKFNASNQEALFGLIHDISHTAFSHVADFMFNTTTKYKSYQDHILSSYAHQTDLYDILKKYNQEHILDDNVIDTFGMIKIPLPALCIDRLEYNVYGGFIEGWLTKEDIHAIIDDLTYVNGTFVFQTTAQAKKLADISIRLSIENWCNPVNCFVYQETAEMLSYAINNNIIHLEDFHFSDDQSLWDTLYTCNDKYIQLMLKNIQHYSRSFYLTSHNDYEIVVQSKFRGVDPLVYTNNDIKKLSEVDATFADYFYNAKVECSKAVYLKRTNPTCIDI